MKLTLNEKLLSVLHVLVQKRNIAITERQLGLIDDHLVSLKHYFDALPDDLVQGVGLQRNAVCFDAISRLRIPKVWLETEAEQLSQFEFGY